MADPNLNFASGVVNGVSTGLDFLDRSDARKQRKQLFSQQQEDRLRGIERESKMDQRNDELYAMQVEDRESAMQTRDEDRTYELERRGVEDKQRDALAPIERQLKRTQLANAETQQRVNAQVLKSKEVSGIWSQATTLYQGGDYEGAQKLISGLSKYGHDPESMNMDTAIKAKSTAGKFIKGEIDHNDPDMVELAKQILTPSLVQSGRDPSRFSIAGIVPTGRMDEDGSPTFAVSMHDAVEGGMKPVTINASSDAEDGILEISSNDLMAATQGFIGASNANAELNLKALGARIGQRAYEKVSSNDALKDKKLEAEIKKIEAETAKIKGEDAEGVATDPSGQADPYRQLFLNSNADSPRFAGIAEVLQSDPNFTFKSGIKAMSEIKALGEEKKYRSMGSDELLHVYQSKKDIERDVVAVSGEKISNFINQYPGMSDKDQEYYGEKFVKYVKQYKDGTLDEMRFGARIQELHKQASKGKGSDLSPQELKRDQTPRSLEQLDRTKTLNELPDAAQLRGY